LSAPWETPKISEFPRAKSILLQVLKLLANIPVNLTTFQSAGSRFRGNERHSTQG
jgi:hypothetical protein